MAVLASSARVDADDILRIRWDEPPADRRSLVLRHRDTETFVPPDHSDTGLTSVDLTGVDLADGTWSVHADGEPVATTDPGFSLDDLAAYARRPRTRTMHAFRGRSGALRVEIRAAEPHAEVTAVDAGRERLVVNGFFAFTEPPAEAGVVAIRRRTGQEVTGEVTIDGDRWRAELAYGPFTAETDRGFWDLRLGGLTVAALLDDIPAKKKRVRFPAGHTGRVRVRAYYTEHDHLAIAATVVPEAAA